MPVKVNAFCQILARFLQKEHNLLLEVNKEGIFSVAPNILQYICARAVYNKRNLIFEAENVTWLWKGQAANTSRPMIFCTENKNNEKQLLQINFMALKHNGNFLQTLPVITTSAEPQQKLVAVILKSTKQQAEEWEKKWRKNVGGILQPVTQMVEAEENIHLFLWKNKSAKATAPVHENADIALDAAVRNMNFESMLQVMKKIISLRTNLEEKTLNAQTQLSTIFKSVFAKEQGVSLEEVYDPEAMAGFTDSQLAKNNFLADMQKTFNISFDNDDFAKIDTINDLVDKIINKKYA